MSEYLTLTERIEITDFLISVLGAFSEKVGERFHFDPGKLGFFDRVWSFLNANVVLTEMKLPVGPIELKAALHENVSLKGELQKKTRGLVEQLVKEAREFALEPIQHVRKMRVHPDRKVVLIVDSVERLRGGGDSVNVREVFQSAKTLFSANYDKLRFADLNIVYTVPPYLSALAGGLGAVYAGGRIYALQGVHIYESRPANRAKPKPHDVGLTKMRTVVERRYPEWREFFTEGQIARLAQHSGGDLRDYFRMIRLAFGRIPGLSLLPVPDSLIADAEDAVRNDMLPIAANDRSWLARIMASHDHELPNLDALPDFARLQEGKYLLHYRNGKDWYDVHPLLHSEVRASGNRQPGT
jgi:hypothetical protein